MFNIHAVPQSINKSLPHVDNAEQLKVMKSAVGEQDRGDTKMSITSTNTSLLLVTRPEHYKQECVSKEEIEL